MQRQLKEIWNLAGYRKDTYLNEHEFHVFLAYIVLMQATPMAPLTPQSLKQSMPALSDLPKFVGIDLPQPPST